MLECNLISIQFWMESGAGHHIGPGPACLAAAAGGNCTLQKMVIKTTSLKGLMVEVDLCFKRILVEWGEVLCSTGTGHRPATSPLSGAAQPQFYSFMFTISLLPLIIFCERFEVWWVSYNECWTISHFYILHFTSLCWLYWYLVITADRQPSSLH